MEQSIFLPSHAHAHDDDNDNDDDDGDDGDVDDDDDHLDMIFLSNELCLGSTGGGGESRSSEGIAMSGEIFQIKAGRTFLSRFVCEWWYTIETKKQRCPFSGICVIVISYLVSCGLHVLSFACVLWQ